MTITVQSVVFVFQDTIAKMDTFEIGGNCFDGLLEGFADERDVRQVQQDAKVVHVWLERFDKFHTCLGGPIKELSVYSGITGLNQGGDPVRFQLAAEPSAEIRKGSVVSVCGVGR